MRDGVMYFEGDPEVDWDAYYEQYPKARKKIEAQEYHLTITAGGQVIGSFKVYLKYSLLLRMNAKRKKEAA